MSSTITPPSNSGPKDPPAPVLAKVPAAENVVLAAGNEETPPAPSNIPVAKGAAGALNDATPLATSNAINVDPASAPEGAALDNVQPAAETVTQTLTGPRSQEVAEVPAAAGVKNGLPATSDAINVAPAPAPEGAVPNKSQPAATTDPPAPELAKVPAAETAVLAVAVDEKNGDDAPVGDVPAGGGIPDGGQERGGSNDGGRDGAGSCLELITSAKEIKDLLPIHGTNEHWIKLWRTSQICEDGTECYKNTNLVCACLVRNLLVSVLDECNYFIPTHTFYQLVLSTRGVGYL